MLAEVTNKAKSARGFATLDRDIVMLEAGASALLDLADHLLHQAWLASGQVLIAPLADREAKTARKRLDAEASAKTTGQSAALSALPSSAGAAPLPPTGDGGRTAR